MRNYDHNRSKQSIWESKPVLIILGIIIVFFAWSVLRFYFKLGDTRQNKVIIREKVETLRSQKVALGSDIEKLQTDSGKEEIFRDNYGLAKSGEELIIIVEEKPAETPPLQGFWRGFWSSFLNWWR